MQTLIRHTKFSQRFLLLISLFFLYINDVKVGERNILASEARHIANYEDGINVGQDLNSPFCAIAYAQEISSES
jgi:hypothetical protein